MFRFFERQVDPYPAAPPATPPKAFFAFLWQASEGVRPWMLATTLLTAAIGAFEAYLFSMMGSIVDWLSTVPPAELWTAERERLLFLGAVLAGSVLLAIGVIIFCLGFADLSGGLPFSLPRSWYTNRSLCWLPPGAQHPALTFPMAPWIAALVRQVAG